MTDYIPTIEQIRSHYVFNQSDQWDPERGDAFDRALAAHDAEVRAEALRGAAESVHAEARWQQDQEMRGAVQLSGAQTAVERLLVVEQLLRQQADHWMTEGKAGR